MNGCWSKMFHTENTIHWNAENGHDFVYSRNRGPAELALSRGVKGRKRPKMGEGHGWSGSQDQLQSLEGCPCLPRDALLPSSVLD